MLGNLVRRLVNLVVLALAGYAFFALPVGRRTPWQHVVAIFSTPPAHEAAEDVQKTGADLRDRVVGEGRRAALALRDAGADAHR